MFFENYFSYYILLCNYIRLSVIPVPFDRTVGPVKHGMSDFRPLSGSSPLSSPLSLPRPAHADGP